MLNHMSVRAIIDRVEDVLLRRTRFETPVDRVAFDATKKGEVIQVRNSKGKLRPIRDAELVEVVRRLHALDSPTVGAFQDLTTRNASYILALILAATDDEGLRAALTRQAPTEAA